MNMGNIRDFLKAVEFLLRLILAICAAVILVGGIIRAGMYVWAPESYYSSIYNVPKDHVYIQAKPHDCEWEKAPIGKKYCHYDKQVTHDQNQVAVTWEKMSE